MFKRNFFGLVIVKTSRVMRLGVILHDIIELVTLLFSNRNVRRQEVLIVVNYDLQCGEDIRPRTLSKYISDVQ